LAGFQKKKPGNPGRSNRASASWGTLARELPSTRAGKSNFGNLILSKKKIAPASTE
jgi:hypothetical protein